MNSKNTFPYHFHGYEPGILTEVFLPKKSKFQGRLYETLTNGFDIKNVKKNFKKNRKQISVLLADFNEVGEITDKRIDSMKSLYWGYSMYEVDGVFLNKKQEITEERNQVVRIMFLPDLEKIESLARGTDRKEVKRVVKKYLSSDSEEREKMARSNKKVADHLNKWIAEVGLFLFGYVVFELCERIKELNDDGKIPLEEEIWVSSFWSLEVNKIKIGLNNSGR
jgi:hypothetical protein